MSPQHRVVIVGGGFGGLYAAQALKRAPVDLTVIDRRNFHLFQPLLYQVATGALSPAEIASPLRVVLQKQVNTRVLMGDVRDIDADGKRVILADGGSYEYDTLIVATGSTHHYFGNDQWEEFAPGLKTVEDATEIRRRVLSAFESAEREPDAEKHAALLTFVVVGGGPTGVELAGALGEIANDTLRHDFRNIHTPDAQIFLIEGAERVLPPYPSDLSASAEKALIALGVRTRTGSRVTGIDAEGVTIQIGERTERIATKTVLWAAGVRANRLGRVLNERAGAPVDKAGRVMVNADLSVPGRQDIFVIGDLAAFTAEDGKQLPGVAPVAMQQGRYVARRVTRRAVGDNAAPVSFKYWDKGSMATIGRASAVAQIGKLHFSGLIAWLAWLFIHLMYLVEFENRVLVLIEWALNYATHNRGARLISGDKRP